MLREVRKMLVIRTEQKEDYAQVYHVIICFEVMIKVPYV